jgi:glycosyltransferase involved in cell wall biosynthesis
LADRLGLSDRLFFTGHVQDMLPIYDGLDIVALTSHTEGLPNVVLEAMCMEKPVVATDVGGTGELVRNGETGLLVRAGDLQAIVESCEFLISRPQTRQAMVRAGKELILRDYDFDIRTRKIERLYEAVAP